MSMNRNSNPTDLKAAERPERRRYEPPTVVTLAEPKVSVVFGSATITDCSGVHKPPPQK